MRLQRVRRGRRLVAVVGAIVLTSTLWAGAAVADPAYPSQDDVDDARAAADGTAGQVAALEVELAANSAALEAANERSALATEAYNQATVDLEQAEADLAAAQEAADAADADVLAASQAVARIAMAAYRNGGDLQQLGILVSADGIEDAIHHSATFDRLGSDAEVALQELAAAEVVADTMHARAQTAMDEKAAAAAERESAATDADAAALAAQTTLESTQAERSGLIAELASLRSTTVELEEQRQAGLDAERQRRESAAAAAAISAPVTESTPAGGAETTAPSAPSTPAPSTPAPSTPAPSTPAPSTPAPSTPAPSTPAPSTPAPSTPAPSAPAPAPAPAPTPAPTPTPPPPAPAPSPPPTTGAGTGQAALNWAKTQLGKPYVYGAAGPNSYDCSGLTMRAYQNAGVNLPRTTRSQYAAVAHVPVGQMRPGDLIFYSNNGSASGIYHVAIYAGNGMRVHAPSPGKSVELTQIWWTNVLPMAGRP